MVPNAQDIDQALDELIQDKAHRGNKQASWEALDSLSKVEVVTLAQQRFAIQLSEAQILSISTKADLARAIVESLKQPLHAPLSDSAPIIHFQPNQQQTMLAKFFRWLMAGYMRCEATGAEHIPHAKPCIIAANHSSHLDSFALMLASNEPFNHFVLMAAKDYYFDQQSLQKKLLKKLINLAPFNRSSAPASLHENILLCQQCVAQNKKLILYPEATRSLDGHMQPFKKGVAMIASELAIPIVPARIRGTYPLLPKGKVFPKPGKVQVTFGHPLHVTQYREQGYQDHYSLCQAITQDLESIIKHLGNES